MPLEDKINLESLSEINKIKNSLISKMLTYSLVGSLCFLTINRNVVWQDDIALWSDAINKSPKKARPYTNIAAKYQRLGMFEEAMNNAGKAVKLEANFVPGLQYMVDIYYEDGRIEDCIKELIGLSNRYPNSHHLFYFIGQAMFFGGNMEGALSNIKHAIKLYPEFPIAKKDIQFIKDYKKILGKKTDDKLNKAETLNIVGMVLARKGRVDRAIRLFSESITANPSFSEAYDNLGIIYLKRGYASEAIKIFINAVKYAHNPIKAMNHLALAYIKNGELIKAEKEFKRVLELDSGNKEALNNLKMLNKIN